MDNNQNLPNTPKLLTRRNIFIALGVVIVLEIIWAGLTIFRPTPSSTPQIPAVKPKTTTISLETPKKEVKKGEKFTVNIRISSEKQADGADLIITYDPKMILLETTPAGQPVIVSTLFSDYPSNVLDTNLGRVTVSGITSQSGGVKADGLFGSLTFVAKTSGTSSISLEFSPNQTTDSNVIESGTGQDVLEKVNNLELTIIP